MAWARWSQRSAPSTPRSTRCGQQRHTLTLTPTLALALTLALTTTLTLTLTLTLTRRYSSLLIDIEDEGGEGEDEGEDEGEVEEAKVEVKRASPPGRPTLLTPYPNLEPNPHHSPLTTQRSLLPQKTCSLLQKTLTTEDLQLATDGLQPSPSP